MHIYLLLAGADIHNDDLTTWTCDSSRDEDACTPAYNSWELQIGLVHFVVLSKPQKEIRNEGFAKNDSAPTQECLRILMTAVKFSRQILS